MQSVILLLDHGWVGSIIGLTSLAVAFVLYRASRATANLVYQKRSLRLIGSDEPAMPPDVEVRYRGHPVERLTKTYLIFWNAGKAMIRGADIVDDDPLRCEFAQDTRVLEVSVVKNTRSANKVTIRHDDNRSNIVLITFDYLDPRDGATIEILHTDSNWYPAVMGTLRGIPQGLVDRGRILGRQRRALRFPLGVRLNLNPLSLLSILSIFIGLITILSIVAPPGSTLSGILNFGLSTEVRKEIRPWMGSFIGAQYLVLGIVYQYLTRRQFPASLDTPGLDK